MPITIFVAVAHGESCLTLLEPKIVNEYFIHTYSSRYIVEDLALIELSESWRNELVEGLIFTVPFIGLMGFGSTTK